MTMQIENLQQSLEMNIRILQKILNKLNDAYALSEKHDNLSDIGTAISTAEDTVIKEIRFLKEMEIPKEDLMSHVFFKSHVPFDLPKYTTKPKTKPSHNADE